MASISSQAGLLNQASPFEGLQLNPIKHDPVLKDFSALQGRIGIFGGSFDPLHNGHIAAAKLALEKKNLSCVVFVPTKQNPLKHKPCVADDRQRFEMIRQTLKDEPMFFVSDIQLRDGTSPYSADLLQEIRNKIIENSSLHLIVGADTVKQFQNWKLIDKVFDLSQIITIGIHDLQIENILSDALRNRLDDIKKGYIECDLPKISATDIRSALKLGLLPDWALPKAVTEYLQTSTIYLSDFTQSSSTPVLGLASPAFVGRLRDVRQGIVELTGADNRTDICRMSRLVPQDAHEFMSWYDANPKLQPTYADDPTWKEWWLNLMQNKDEKLFAYKICSSAGEILGVLALKEVIDWYDNKKTTYINGLRVSPKYIHSSNIQGKYQGVGNALLTYAVVKSLENGSDGIGVNSSLGVEDFYRNVGAEETKAFDGIRSYFTIKGINRLKFLLKEFE